ncbi:MAG: hypothetical protein JXP34_08460 [Planctomycetes bacterium]|nr:hypothetical protein [Planctomycetota bacterium]
MKQSFDDEERLYRSLPGLPSEERAAKAMEILSARDAGGEWRPLKARVTDPAVLAILIRQSRDADPTRSRIALADLACSGTEEAEARLQETAEPQDREMLLARLDLGDPNPHRIDAAEALVPLGVDVRLESARVVLLGGAYDGLGLPEQLKAVRLLSRMEGPESREILAECLLRVEDPRLVISAARTLRGLGGRPGQGKVLPALRGLLASIEPQDRAHALDLLDAADTEVAIVLVAEALEDEPDPWLRQEMLLAILERCRRAGNEAFDEQDWDRAVTGFERAARDPRTAPDPMRRAYALLRAGRTEEARALYGELAVLRADDPHVKEAIAFLEKTG